MDIVFIKGLELNALIGVYDFERTTKQRVVVDLELHTCLLKAAQSDDVNDTLDYGKVAERLADIAGSTNFQLLESLANEMIEMIAEEFLPKALKITIHKPDILDNAASVGICLSRQFG